MKRMHVHVGVNDLAQSVRFYSTLFGGEPARTGGCTVVRTDGSAESLRSKAAMDLHKGDHVEMTVGGGGGYGHPSQRGDALIDRDLEDGILTRDPRAGRRLAAE